VGAKKEVYELIRGLTGEGLAIVLTSDTLEETIGLSHSVVVMRDGEITHRAEAIHEVIGYCKADPDDKVVDAIDAYVKKVQAGGQSPGSTIGARKRAPPGPESPFARHRAGLRIAALPHS
jgi:ABC-type multidrug transport system ATPase subunit